MGLWRRLFAKNASSSRPLTSHTPRPALAIRTAGTISIRESPTTTCLACRRAFHAPLATCPQCGSAEMLLADPPAWLMLVQAHVTAVQLNDRAVQLFRAGRLDDAIEELRRGLAAHPHYATGYSNLGFLYLRKGQIDQAADCLLRALAVDPHHHDAPDHLFDVLRALVGELGQIGFSDGFFAEQPGGNFDDCRRHIRARAIGALLAKTGQSGAFMADGQALQSVQLMIIVFNTVQRMMRYHRNSTSLTFAWDGIGGWGHSV